MSKSSKEATRIMDFILEFQGAEEWEAVAGVKIKTKIQNIIKKMQRDIKSQDLIISQYQSIMAELNAITGNTKGSSELRNIVGLLQVRANIASKYNKAWEKAPTWANVLLLGDGLTAWASRFENEAIFIPVGTFYEGGIVHQKLHLLEGHSWSIIATRPAK
ncbi:hypothetical protein [Polynucleobacter sp.]|uniref:hypothetical protein n=1 Tax=Polynucleobacter sp. TaxID=2029855 RepID=UPI003F69EF48